MRNKLLNLNIMLHRIVEKSVTYLIDLKQGVAHITHADPSLSEQVFLPYRVNFQGQKYPITTICAYAFADCRNINYVSIPIDVTRIEEGAFANCINLKDIRLPYCLKYLGARAFLNCAKLEVLHMVERVKYIGDEAFKGCPHIRYAQLPHNLEYVGEDIYDKAIEKIHVLECDIEEYCRMV